MNDWMKYLVCFILGWILARMMGNGFSVGGLNTSQYALRNWKCKDDTECYIGSECQTLDEIWPDPKIENPDIVSSDDLDDKQLLIDHNFFKKQFNYNDGDLRRKYCTATEYIGDDSYDCRDRREEATCNNSWYNTTRSGTPIRCVYITDEFTELLGKDNVADTPKCRDWGWGDASDCHSGLKSKCIAPNLESATNPYDTPDF